MSIFIKNFYSSIHLYDKLEETAFDEGPLIYNKIIGVNSSSINTTSFDAFRQGVEITQEKHNIGMFKISAGTPGHIIRPHTYGVNELDIISTKSFIEIDYFNPVKYIKVQEPGLDFSKVITFPIITADSNQSENTLFNGIIEPLTIRSIISFFSIESPYESHACRGSMMGGNSNQINFSSEQILTVDYNPTKKVPFKQLVSSSISSRAYINNAWYLDAFESIGTGVVKQTVGYLNYRENYIDSFIDGNQRTYLKELGITEQTHGKDMVNVFLTMTGSTDNYISPKKKSATAGFVYDNIGSAGTDSIAFGGMTY